MTRRSVLELGRGGKAILTNPGAKRGDVCGAILLAVGSDNEVIQAVSSLDGHKATTGCAVAALFIYPAKVDHRNDMNGRNEFAIDAT